MRNLTPNLLVVLFNETCKAKTDSQPRDEMHATHLSSEVDPIIDPLPIRDRERSNYVLIEHGVVHIKLKSTTVDPSQESWTSSLNIEK